MKKILTISLLFLVGCAFGQTTYLTSEKSHTYMGVSGGLAVVGIANQNNYGFREMDYQVSIGGSIGLTFGREWSRKHRLETSLQLASSGQSYYAKVEGIDDTKEVRMTMVQMPLVYKRRVFIFHNSGNGSESLFHLGIGVQPAILTSATVEWKVQNKEVSMGDFLFRSQNDNIEELRNLLGEDGQPESYTELFSTFDIQGILTAGYIYKASLKWMFELELRASYGLLDMNHESWRLSNRQGEYGASRNVRASLRVSGYYTLWD